MKKNNMQTFIEWLEDDFIGGGEWGGIPIIKDNCEDLFDSYLSGLDGDDYEKLANRYAKEMVDLKEKEVIKNLTPFPNNK